MNITGRAVPLIALGLAALLACAGGSESAGSALPAPDVFVMSADGSGERDLSNNVQVDLGPAWSPDGTRIAFSSHATCPSILVMNADGSNPRQLTNPVCGVEPAWSPDGTKIAFSAGTGAGDIVVVNADGSDPRNLTNSGADDAAPTWSPDGTKIAFSSGVFQGNYDIFVVSSSGGSPTQLTTGVRPDIQPVWSPNGGRIAFAGSQGDSNYDVFVMNADGSAQTNLTNDPRYENQPTWSPDSRRIAFVRNPNQPSPGGGEGLFDRDIFVMNVDGTGQVDLISNPYYDEDPAWSPDGNRIAFIRSDSSFIGPPPSPPCRVPRVAGRRLPDARGRIVAAHYKVGRVRKVRSRKLVGRVIAQSPRAGTALRCGGKVNLTVGRSARRR